MSDYVHPSPVESIHRRDDDDDDDDSEGEGLAREDRGAAARRDLGLSGSDEEDDEDEYEVELIVQARGRGSGRRYRVRWQGFTEDHDTWEPAEHLHPQLIAEFEREELAEQGGDKAAAAGDEAAEHQGGCGGRGGRGRGGRGRGGRRGRGGGGGSGGSGGDGGSSGTTSSKKTRPKSLTLTTVPMERFPESTTFVAVSLRSTGGKAPRIVSLASQVVGSSDEPFYKWVKTESSPTREAAAQLIDGVSMGTVQEQATDKFAVVGGAWIDWFGRCTSDASSAVCLLVWDEVRERSACSPFELLFTELRRAQLLPLLGANPEVELLLMDLGVALASAGTYAAAPAAQWPNRKGAAPRLSLRNAATFVQASTRGRLRCPLGEAAGEPLSELQQLAVVLSDPSGIVAKAGRKALAWRTECFCQQAELTVTYETGIRDDPVLWPWREFVDPPLEQPNGPAFTPQEGSYNPEGGPSRALREHLGMLDKDGNPQEVKLSADELMLQIFLFYFQDHTGVEGVYSVMELIVNATNAKATEPVVRALKPTGSGYELRPPRAGDSRQLLRTLRPRVAGWRELSIGELYVFLGLRLVMGAHWRPQLSDYWCTKYDGYRVPFIPHSMREDRFKEILANLAFLMLDDVTSYPGDLLRKLRPVDNALIERATLAWDAEPEAAVDEHRCPLSSRYAKPLITVLYCKPIKVGINNYLFTYRSGYTPRWQWWDGKASKAAMPKGQPTDVGELNEENDEELGYIMQLIVNLVGGLEGTGITIYLDKAFSSVKLARRLASMGIAMVGMTRGTRPKTMKLSPEHYFAFSKTAKAEADNLERWHFRRIAYTPLPDAHGRCPANGPLIAH